MANDISVEYKSNTSWTRATVNAPDVIGLITITTYSQEVTITSIDIPVGYGQGEHIWSMQHKDNWFPNDLLVNCYLRWEGGQEGVISRRKPTPSSAVRYVKSVGNSSVAGSFYNEVWTGERLSFPMALHVNPNRTIKLQLVKVAYGDGEHSTGFAVSPYSDTDSHSVPVGDVADSWVRYKLPDGSPKITINGSDNVTYNQQVSVTLTDAAGFNRNLELYIQSEDTNVWIPLETQIPSGGSYTFQFPYAVDGKYALKCHATGGQESFDSFYTLTCRSTPQISQSDWTLMCNQSTDKSDYTVSEQIIVDGSRWYPSYEVGYWNYVEVQLLNEQGSPIPGMTQRLPVIATPGETQTIDFTFNLTPTQFYGNTFKFKITPQCDVQGYSQLNGTPYITDSITAPDQPLDDIVIITPDGFKFYDDSRFGQRYLWAKVYIGTENSAFKPMFNLGYLTPAAYYVFEDGQFVWTAYEWIVDEENNVIYPEYVGKTIYIVYEPVEGVNTVGIQSLDGVKTQVASVNDIWVNEIQQNFEENDNVASNVYNGVVDIYNSIVNHYNLILSDANAGKTINKLQKAVTEDTVQSTYYANADLAVRSLEVLCQLKMPGISGQTITFTLEDDFVDSVISSNVADVSQVEVEKGAYPLTTDGSYVDIDMRRLISTGTVEVPCLILTHSIAGGVKIVTNYSYANCIVLMINRLL